MNEMTIKSNKSVLLEEMKSKFYAFAIPCKTVDEFLTSIAALRKEHSKAKHIIYAYRIGTASKSCDDKEPKGTAGRPILELLNKKNLNNVAVIVVRYFGGTKLGASKLLRTYLNSAIRVLNECEFENL